MSSWQDYQEETADFFRSIGLAASTDVILQGVRTEHNVDVLVKLEISGFKVTWIVECKYWRTAVTKLHVLALREIVSDAGADRGIILCESGFQSGAVEAANLTNVQVTSLAALTVSSKDAIYAARLRDLYDRTELCRRRYWDIPKDVRIEKGLRFDVGGGDESLYSGARVIDIAAELLVRAFRGFYPIQTNPLSRIFLPEFPVRFNSHQDLVASLEPLLSDLEARLAAV